MAGGKSYKHGRKKKVMAGKSNKESFTFDEDISKDSLSRSKSSKHQMDKRPSMIRKQVDPETVKYFSEIANLFESGGVELEERSVICGNALEETRGKEFELSTDYIISHTLQTLLEGCDVDHLCSFLRGCADLFPLIAMDRSGSHVAETALKSLAMHLQDNEAYSVIEETISTICKVIVVNPVDMMCNCYGSHVLRSVLCLCGGVSLNSPEFHGAKPSATLAERLNLEAPQIGVKDSHRLHQGFPGLLKFLVSEVLKCTGEDVKTLQVDQYGSLVLQTALKLLAGHDEELLEIIPILFGCKKENLTKGNTIAMTVAGDIVELIKETAYSHLMEVILEVAPDSLYDEILMIFQNSLFELSSHHCGNFVVQALVSRARDKKHLELILEELCSKFKDLLELGRSGVIAYLIAASQRLHTLEHKCCQALTSALCSPDESPRCIVPRMLFLENYFKDKSNWSWPTAKKMHVMGSLILQIIFKFQNELIQPYITSLTTMEVDHVLEAAKDAGGARVIEAFLGSTAPGKQKRRLINKLKGHFGELAMHSSGSFLVDKCFNASNVSLREAIASDLLAMETELSKTKQGPYLLRKLDIDRFANRPDQWKSKQESKESTYKEFYNTFGSVETNSSKNDSFLADTKKTSHKKELNKMRKEIDDHLASKKHPKHGDATESGNQKPFLSVEMKGKKRNRKDMPLKASKKKRKV